MEKITGNGTDKRARSFRKLFGLYGPCGKSCLHAGRGALGSREGAFWHLPRHFDIRHGANKIVQQERNDEVITGMKKKCVPKPGDRVLLKETL